MIVEMVRGDDSGANWGDDDQDGGKMDKVDNKVATRWNKVEQWWNKWMKNSSKVNKRWWKKKQCQKQKRLEDLKKSLEF